MILSAQTIRSLCFNKAKFPLIFPFVERAQEPLTGMSFGLSVAGYDVRLDDAVYLTPRGGFCLSSTLEYVIIPDDVMVFVKDKSSLARRGVSVFNTVLEPGWRGYTTLELLNLGDEYVRLPAGAPVAQFVFCRLDQPTDHPYNGKYQDQKRGPQPAL